MPPPSMPRKRSSPVASSPSPPPQRPVIPRTKAPRAHSNPTSASTGGGIQPPRRPSNSHAHSHPLLMSGRSQIPKDGDNDEAIVLSETVTSPAASGSTSAGPVSSALSAHTPAIAQSGTSTPPTSVPSLASAPATGPTAPLKKDRSNSGSSTGTSGTGASGLGSLLAPMSTGTAASTAPTPPPVAVPQTGLGKMAAAAKARAEGIPARRGSDVQGGLEAVEEDHPLSEISLKARDYHTILTMNRLFHVPTRWRLIRPLGQGAYGLVIQVQDEYTAEPVAIKCITRVFDKVILARRALREITLLRHFGGHENLTGLIDLDNVWDGYNEIYLYMEPMEADLHQIVRSGQPLSNSHIQFFMYQLLRGMKYIHSANVIHRDLKPGNLLVNSDCELKICDFGLARGYRPQGSAEDGLKLTEYVATRWYRAPEVMLSNSSYTTAMDVWSIGCILAEVLSGKPLFKGKDYVDQINLIVAAVGTPSEEVLTRVGSDKACTYMRSLPFSEPKDLQAMLPRADSNAVDLLRHLITFDPDARYDVVQALNHAYVETYHDETDEPSCPAVFDKWEEVESLTTIEELREAISREIREYRAEVRDASYIEEEDISDRGSSMIGWDEEGEVTMTGTPELIPDISHDYNPTRPREEGQGPAGSIPHSTSFSPKTVFQAQLGMGVSPRTAMSALPPYRGRERERGKDRTGSPKTPASVFTDDSTPGHSQPPSAHPSASAPTPSTVPVPVPVPAPGPGYSGRTSRRSSAHSTHRARSSFLFSSPLGGGMTPLPSMSAIVPLTASGSASGQAGSSAPDALGTSAFPSGHHGHHGHRPSMDWAQGRKSRTTSTTSEFASLRPLIRQLSVVGLEGLGIDENGKRLPQGGGEGYEVPPMTVSPSDAPPSEKPKSFANTPHV